MTAPTTPAEAVAQWCEANGWTENPESAPAGTAVVVIADGRVVANFYATDRSVPEWRHNYPDCTIYADLPKLPTEPGSVIVDVTDRDGDHYAHMASGRSFWSGRTDAGAWYSNIDPKHIVSWHPGKVVRADA